MCPGIASKLFSVLQAIIMTLFYILVQYCEFRCLSLYHKDSLSALFLASERENSPKTSTCCCPTFCAMIVGIKIKSFANEVKVLQCFTPSQFNFHSHLLCCFSQHLQLLSVEQIPAVACGVCYPWLSVWQNASAALWPAALCPAACAVPSLSLYQLCLALPMMQCAHSTARSVEYSKLDNFSDACWSELKWNVFFQPHFACLRFQIQGTATSYISLNTCRPCQEMLLPLVLVSCGGAGYHLAVLAEVISTANIVFKEVWMR